MFFFKYPLYDLKMAFLTLKKFYKNFLYETDLSFWNLKQAPVLGNQSLFSKEIFKMGKIALLFFLILSNYLTSCSPDITLSPIPSKLQAPQKLFLKPVSRIWLEELLGLYGISAYYPEENSQKTYYKGPSGSPWQDFYTEPLIADTNRYTFLVQRKQSDSLFKCEYIALTKTFKIYYLSQVRSKDGGFKLAYELKDPSAFPLALGQTINERLGLFYVLLLHQPWGKKWTKPLNSISQTTNYTYKAVWKEGLDYDKDKDAIHLLMALPSKEIGMAVQLYHIEPRSKKSWFKKKEGLSFLYRKQL